MAVTRIPPVMLAVLLSACAAEPVLLNSERIQRKFGSYGIDVLASESGLRRSSLYSLENGRHVCRTYALVRFVEQPDERYGAAHAQVLAGNSIGETFKSHGFNLHKQTLHIGALRLPDGDSAISGLMDIEGGRELALHVYQLLLVRDEQVFDYALIMESHHPDYLSGEDLHSLYEYDDKSALPAPQLAALTELMLAGE